MADNTARKLIEKHELKARLDVQQGLYRQSGDWFHTLKRFPSVLMDGDGYILFESAESYEKFFQLFENKGVLRSDAKNWITVKGGIANFPGYTLFIDKENSSTYDEIESLFLEGRARHIYTTRYERDPKARAKCLAHWMQDCIVCGLNFEKTYGEVGKNYIHVHHIVPLSTIGTEYRIDPVKDLRPVCANCHAMLHRRDPPFSVEELQTFLAGVANTIDLAHPIARTPQRSKG